MEKHAVLLVTGQKAIYDSFKKGLGRQFDVLHASRPELATVVFGSLRPWAVIADTHQGGGTDGHLLCRSLRARRGGQRCIFIVFELDPSLLEGEMQLFDDTSHGPDVFLTSPSPPTSAVSRILGERLSVRKVSARVGPQVEHPTFGQLLQSGLDKTHLRELIEEQRDQTSTEDLSELSWGELLNQRVTPESLNVLLSREINLTRPLRTDELQDDMTEMSWGQLLRARVTPQSLKALLTKPLIRMPDDDEVDEDEVYTAEDVASLRAEIASLKASKASLEAKLAEMTESPEDRRSAISAARGEAQRYALQSVIRELLPLISEQKASDALHDALKRLGVQPFGEVGQSLDERLHEIVSRRPATDGQAKNVVVEVFQPGYKHDGVLLRKALVCVSSES